MIRMIVLKSLHPFSRGARRECYVHPNDPHICLKIALPGQDGTNQRRAAKFPKRYLPLRLFDENLDDLYAYQNLSKPTLILNRLVLPQVHGIVETDRGPALSMELITNSDGTVAPSLKEHILRNGVSEKTQKAVDELKTLCTQFNLVLKDTKPNNIAAALDGDGDIIRLAFIDGFGLGKLFSFYDRIPFRAKRIVARNNKRLDSRVSHFAQLHAEGRTCEANSNGMSLNYEINPSS